MRRTWICIGVVLTSCESRPAEVVSNVERESAAATVEPSLSEDWRKFLIVGARELAEQQPQAAEMRALEALLLPPSETTRAEVESYYGAPFNSVRESPEAAAHEIYRAADGLYLRVYYKRGEDAERVSHARFWCEGERGRQAPSEEPPPSATYLDELHNVDLRTKRLGAALVALQKSKPNEELAPAWSAALRLSPTEVRNLLKARP